MNTTVVIEEQRKQRSLVERALDRKARKDEAGLALLDVLIGMALFALIALIALQALGQYRQKAFMTGTTSDARSIGTAIEAESINQQDYPVSVTVVGGNYRAAYGGTAAAPAAPFVILGKASTGNTVGTGAHAYTRVAPTATAPAGFSFCIQHSSNGSADAASRYQSLSGGVSGSSDKGGCATIS